MYQPAAFGFVVGGSVPDVFRFLILRVLVSYKRTIEWRLYPRVTIRGYYFRRLAGLVKSTFGIGRGAAGAAGATGAAAGAAGAGSAAVAVASFVAKNLPRSDIEMSQSFGPVFTARSRPSVIQV